MQFNAGCLFFDGNQFISGFRFGDMGYFFVGSRSSGVYTYILRIHNYTTNSFSDSLPILGLDLVNHKLRVSRTADQVTLSVHQLNDEPITTDLYYGSLSNPAHLGGILATYNLASSSSLGTVVVNLQIAGQGFYDLQVARNELAPVEITNHFELKLEKVASTGIRPIYNFNRYEKVVSTGKTESYTQQIIGSNNLSDQTIETDGLEVTFSATFNNLVKNTDTSIQSPVNPNNTLGAVGQNITYDLCYLNYNLSNVTGQAQAYNFDTTTSTDTPPPLLSNRQFGPCLFDQDKDGIYDLYEDLDNDQNLSNDDTDFDGIPNYLDPDDDGDGIFTKYEGVSKPTPNKYLNPHNQVGLLQNTNDPTTVNPSNPNPYRVTNTIPDYLDNDDDGDGYKTWETTEGGPGVASYTIDLTTNPAPVEPFNGQPYTQNTDNNGAVDYLEYTDIVYQEQLPLVQNDYQNTMGDKRYELTNHLGNVLAVITDLKLPSSDLTYFKPDVVAYNDYYPFGMIVPNRYGKSETAYRYGFNGMEGDTEIRGEGNSYDFGARFYDSRIANWLSPDPLAKMFPEMSPYNYALSNPIYYIDPDGRSVEPADQVASVTPTAVLGTAVHVMAKTYFDKQPGWQGEVTFAIPYIKKGKADLIYKDINGKTSVWEIKPVSYRAGTKHEMAKVQVARYRALAAMEDIENGGSGNVSIGTQGGGPSPIIGTLPLVVTEGIYTYDVKFFIPKGEEGNGIIYYTLNNPRLNEEIKEVVRRTAPVLEKTKEIASDAIRATAEVAEDVAIGIAVVGIGAAAVALAPETGGASLAAGAILIGPLLENGDFTAPIEGPPVSEETY